MLFHLKPLKFFFLVFVSAFAQNAIALDYRVGYQLGFGGTGLQTTKTVEGTALKVDRADSPLTVGFVYEFLTSDKTSFAVDHTRGIQLSPFSSGVGFTGATWKWYFGGEIPSVPKVKDKSFLIVTRRVYYAGATAGVANGTITRGGDVIRSVSASGAYYGFRAGYDMQKDPGVILRTELFFAKTPTGSGFVKSSLSAFSISAGWLFLY